MTRTEAGRTHFLRLFVAAACSLALLAGCGREEASPPPFPNILLIFADDMGWNDLGAAGNAAIRTPNLDRLANEGALFEHAYTVTSSCSASRGALLTGRYPHSNGLISLMEWHKPPFRELFPMRATRTLRHSMRRSETLMSQLFHELGYQTAIIGKWHVSVEAPTSWGFDAKLRFSDRAYGGLRPPFFLYFNPTHTHQPFRSSPDFPYDPASVVLPPYFVENAELRSDLANYYSAVSNMDHEIGQLLDWLDASGQAEDTIVVFASDNGPPYARAKATLYEWGVRTPLLIRYPRRIRAGTRVPALVSTLDILPTLLELLGRPIPERLQGTSLLPLIDDPLQPGRDAVFLESNYHVFYNPGRAVRSGHWKYIRNFDRRAPFYTARESLGLTLLRHPLDLPPRPAEELYDLEEDPLEGTNLAGDPAYARDLHRMRTLLSDWMQATHDDPLAEQARERPPAKDPWPGGWFGPERSPAPNIRRGRFASEVEQARASGRAPVDGRSPSR